MTGGGSLTMPIKRPIEAALFISGRVTSWKFDLRGFAP
jgi:hypothetical protein